MRYENKCVKFVLKNLTILIGIYRKLWQLSLNSSNNEFKRNNTYKIRKPSEKTSHLFHRNQCVHPVLFLRYTADGCHVSSLQLQTPSVFFIAFGAKKPPIYINTTAYQIKCGRRALRLRFQIPVLKSGHRGSSLPCFPGWTFHPPYIWHNHTSWPIVEPSPLWQ